MTRSGRFYSDAAEKCKKVWTEGIEVTENEDKNEGDVVLRQLKKTQAHLSIWELLCASQEHRRAMVEALSKIRIPEDANPTMFVGPVQNEAS